MVGAAEKSRQTPEFAGSGGQFLLGMKLLGRGFAMYGRSPRLLAIGMLPAVISMVIVFGAIGALLYFISDLAALVTWFADDWSQPERTITRIAAGIAIVVISVLLSVVTYTALTLIIGDPFYEVISKRIEDRVGGAPDEADLPWYVTLRWNLADSLRLLGLSLAVSIPLFFAGFIPAVGQTVVPVLDVVLGGWLLAIELTGVPFNRRGLRLADRRKLLRANRSLALGFGIPVFLLLLIPFAAILVIPAAIVGSTLLTRSVLKLPINEPVRGAGPVVPGYPPLGPGHPPR